MSAEKQRRRRVLSPPPPTGSRLIRKYGNRRLYDTRTSRYVTLGDLIEVFSGEEEVQVVDAVSGEDLTKKVLAQAILFEEDRRGAQIIPIQLLRALLKQKNELSREQFERKIGRLLGEFAGARGKAVEHAAVEEQPARELDDLKRRLKALESHLGGSKKK